MTAEVRLVDADELRRRIDGAIAGKTDGTPWGDGRRYGLRVARRHLDAMPTTTAPKGWTRDEVLAELAKHPDNVCEGQNIYTGEWVALARELIDQWRPEVSRFDVRVVRSTPDPEWVPLTKLVGRTIHGETAEVAGWRLSMCDGVWWPRSGQQHPLTVDEQVRVAVRPEAAT